MEKNLKKNVCVYTHTHTHIKPNHPAIQQKLTQHCNQLYFNFFLFYFIFAIKGIIGTTHSLKLSEICGSDDNIISKLIS